MSLLNKEAAMEYCGDSEEIYESVLEVFEEECAQQLEQIKEYYAAQNWAEFVVVVHGLKNSALTVGALQLSEMSKQMEFAGKEQRIADIQMQYASYVQLIEDTLADVKQARAGLGE